MNTVNWREAQNPFGHEVTRDSQAHAERVYPEESVGFVVAGKYIELENVHEDPLNYFKVDSNKLVEYRDQIEAVIHSHPLENHPSHPSQEDIETQIAWGIPFGIQIINENGAGNIMWFGDQIQVADYVGRPYIYGIYDCYSLWRDYYKIELGITVPLTTNSEGFWNKGQELYKENADRSGFYEVDKNKLQKYDIILIKIKSEIPNHGILYMGGDQGLHHMPYRLSTHDTISKYINPNRAMFDSVWRHKDLSAK